MTHQLPPISEKVFDGGKLPAQGEWTYEDYRKLPDDGWRYEVIQGVLHMTPAPRTEHQSTLRRLAFEFGKYLEENSGGEYFFAPVDVLLRNVRATPVQPDLVFLRQEHLDQVKEDFIDGSPDLIVEILSPSNWISDRRDKFQLYAEAGIPEYWIIDPALRSIEVFVLVGGTYSLLGQFGPGDVARSEVLTGFAPTVDHITP